MTFFYDLNKRLKDVLDAPKSVHKTLNEQDMSRAAKGYEKYGKKGMEALAKAGREGKDLDPIRAKYDKYDNKKDVEEGLGSIVKKIGGGMKKAAHKAMDVVAPGDEALLKDLQKKTGMPQTGKKPQTMAFHKSNSVDDNAVVAKEEYGPLEEKAAKPDYLDLDKDGNRKESMKQAAADKKKDMSEDWDTMMKDVERRRSEVKPGHKVAGAKGDIEKTATGVRHTRRYDPKTGETETGDEVGADGQPAKRGRGRPKGSTGKIGAKGPSGKSKLMTREEIEEAIAALEQAGYSVEERKLTKPEMSKREEVVKSMKKHKGDFERRYGDRGEEVMYATATKMAKKKNKAKDEVDETTVAGSVAPSAAEPKSKGKGGITFGKGIYDSMNREVEAMIAESMNVSINMSNDGHGGPNKSLTVTATDDDAEMLGKLLKMAGLGSSAGGCGCGSSPCSCKSAERVEENQPDWPTDEVVTGNDDPHQTRWAGGPNKPKDTVAGDGQTTVPVTAVQVSKEADKDLEEQEQVMAPESHEKDLDEELQRIRKMAGLKSAMEADSDPMEGLAGAAIGGALGGLAADSWGAAAGSALGHLAQKGLEADRQEQKQKDSAVKEDDIEEGPVGFGGSMIGGGLGAALAPAALGPVGSAIGGAAGAALGQLVHKGLHSDSKDQKPTGVKEDDMEEGNRFLYNLKKAREAGKKKADLDGDGDLEKVRESINSMWKAYKG